MFCDEALDAVEAIAAGELKPEGRIAEHFAACPHCAMALNSARALDRLLRERPIPATPAQFTARALARVRRARWQSEQYVDITFNLVIALVIAAIFFAVWEVLSRTGLLAVSTDAVDLVGRGFVTLTRRLAPSLPLYIGAATLVGTALALWWWAERDSWVNKES